LVSIKIWSRPRSWSGGFRFGPSLDFKSKHSVPTSRSQIIRGRLRSRGQNSGLDVTPRGLEVSVAVQSLSSVFVLRVTVCGYLISIINTGVPTCIPTHLPMDGSGCRRRCHFTASNSPTTSCTVADTLESHGLFSLLFV